MKKVIWIVHQDASTPKTGMGGRQFYLSEELTKKGYEVYLIASASHHLLRHKPKFSGFFYIEKISGFNFVWVKNFDYREAHSKLRVLNWFVFPILIQLLTTKSLPKPDVVLCSSPSPTSFLGAELLSKRFGSRLVFEVRDIWPRTLIELGGYSPTHPLIRLFSWIEARAYRVSDKVISNLKNANEHMESYGMHPNKFSWIPNGYSSEELSLKEKLPKNFRRRIPQDKFIVGYAGTVGVANALNTLVEAAHLIREHENIHIVIVGIGKEKSKLIEMAENLTLSNISFLEPVSKSQIYSLLEMFDVCYIGWKNESLYKFGIGANKIPEYLISGKPIIHSYSGSCDPIKKCNAGISVKAENCEELATAILKMSSFSSGELTEMGARGKEEAQITYSYSSICEKLINDVLDS